MALGARPDDVQRMIISSGMKLAGIAVAFGLPIALLAAKLSASLLYGLKPYDIATFTTIPTLLILISLLACWLPSRAVARVSPMVALRVD